MQHRSAYWIIAGLCLTGCVSPITVCVNVAVVSACGDVELRQAPPPAEEPDECTLTPAEEPDTCTLTPDPSGSTIRDF